MLDPVIIGVIGLAIIMILVLFKVPVGVTLALVGFLGIWAAIGIGPAIPNMSWIPLQTVNRYEFAVLPLFTLMGEFVSGGGIGAQAYTTARAWVGQIRGGLAIATVLGCGLFAAVCGSSLATAVTMSKVSHPEMKRFNYADTLAVGCVAAGGSLGMMIPPSMAFVLLGVLTDVSIGKLFIAGILPGITQIIFYCITIYILCKRNPLLGPAGPQTTFKEKVVSTKETWPVALLFLLVMGGIYGGVFTAAEAGAVGAFGALIIALAKRNITGQGLLKCLMDTAKTTSMIIAVLIGAYIFMRFLAVTRIPFAASAWVSSLGISSWFFIAIILLLFIVLGTFFDMIAVVTITAPILFPMVTSMGFNPIWYCVLMVRVIEMGFVSPPYGINLFGVAGSSGVPIGTVYRGVIPFFIADIANVVLLAAVPQISTFLPDIMMSK